MAASRRERRDYGSALLAPADLFPRCHHDLALDLADLLPLFGAEPVDERVGVTQTAGC
jgi:hypothetical protein